MNKKKIHINFFYKGRVALYAILKALQLPKGSPVFLPGFTCVAVANVIKYLDLEPVYVDIDPDLFTMSVGDLKSKIAVRPKVKDGVILAQNTFGLAPPLDEILGVARELGWIVVEDCAHGLGGSYRGKPNGTLADASFYSTQWSKPLVTGLGGIGVVRDEGLADRLRREWQSYPYPTFRERLFLWLLLKSYTLWMKPTLFWRAQKLYRFLSSLGFVPGSSSALELREVRKPPHFEKRMPRFLVRQFFSELKKLPEVTAHRREIAARYDAVLEELKLSKFSQPSYARSTYLRYPLRVRDKESFLREAEREKLEVGDWFLSPLHPVRKGLEKWGYVTGCCPIAEATCKSIVNLPTHTKVVEKDLKKVQAFLRDMKKRGFV